MHALRPSVIALALLAGCPKATPPAPSVDRLVIVSANDTYRAAGVPEEGLGGFPRLATLRRDLAAEGPVLVLHAGDLLSPSFLSRATGGAHMIDALNQLDGVDGFDPHLLVTLGNHEFDRSKCADAPALEAILDASDFRWLSANIRWGERPGSACDARVASARLYDRALVPFDGFTVGVTGVTIDSKHPAYIAGFDDPIATLGDEVAALRSEGADLVVALTHLPQAVDRAALSTLAGPRRPDLLLGGHDHVAVTEDVGGAWLLKADSELRSVQIVEVTRDAGGPWRITPTLRALDASIPEDPALAAAIGARTAEVEAAWCADRTLPADCLADVVGRTATPLDLLETRLRTVETSGGSWLADLARAGHPGADVALLNSGGLRLDLALPAGTEVTRKHLEQLFPFGSALSVVRIDGRTLAAVIARSVEDWTGSGHWLQVSGLRFVHDPEAGVFRDLTLADGQPVEPGATYNVVVPRYLVDPSIGDQDGYTMLTPSMVLPGQTLPLRALVEAGLVAAGTDGIRPATDGRICTVSDDVPCTR